jgi:hypothetical protein
MTTGTHEADPSDARRDRHARSVRARMLVARTSTRRPHCALPWLPLLAAVAVAVSNGGCATSAESADAARRRDVVVVPEDAQPVERIRWRDVRSTEPLNQRLVLMHTRDRPYLLVLEHPCQSLRSDSVMIVSRSGTRMGGWFTPRVDMLAVADSMGGGVGGGGVAAVAVGGPASGAGGPSARSAVCRPDTLYAIRVEDVDWLRQSLAPE